MKNTTNYHPNHRYLALAHISQVRMMVNRGHPMYRTEGREIIKDAQRRLAHYRNATTGMRGLTHAQRMALLQHDD